MAALTAVRFASWAGLAALVLLPAGLVAQVRVGDVVDKDVLTRSVGVDQRTGESLELVSAVTGQLTTMRPRIDNGELSGAVGEQREIFLTRHARASVRGEVFDRGVAAVRDDEGRYTVLLVARYDLGYVVRLTTLRPPGASAPNLLHVRYAQTGSGGVTEDLLYALGPDNRLVEVPVDEVDLSDRLAAGEYLCCGRFTSFDEELIELTVFVTREGRNAITDRLRVRYELEGRFRRDEAARTYRPDFTLAVIERGQREAVGND